MDAEEIAVNLLFITAYSLFIANLVARYNLVNRALSSLPVRLNNPALLSIAIACALIHGYLNKKIGHSVFTPPDATESYYKPLLEVPRVISFIGLWLGILSLSHPMFSYLGKQMMFQKPWITKAFLTAGFIYPAVCIIVAGLNLNDSKGRPEKILDAVYCIPQILAPYVEECAFFTLIS